MCGMHTLCAHQDAPALQGMQRQIALVAKLLRDEVDPVTLDALQNR